MHVIDDTINFDDYLAEPDESAKVVPASQFADEIIDRIYDGGGGPTGVRLPWPIAENCFRLRPAEVTIWAGVNGHGKTMSLSQVILGQLDQGARACIASFEMKPVSTMSRMVRQASFSRMPHRDYIRDFSAWTDGKLWLYDQQGRGNADRVISVARYSATVLGCTHFVIDSLMKCGIGEADYDAQIRFVDKLCSMAMDTGMHIHLVCHSRKGKDELEPTGKMDVRGASGLTDQVDNVVIVYRNKKKERDLEAGKPVEADHDALLIIDKQRHYEWEGSLPLWFDRDSYTYTDATGHRGGAIRCGERQHEPEELDQVEF